MKRVTEKESETEIEAAIEELSLVRHLELIMKHRSDQQGGVAPAEGATVSDIRTRLLLALCNLILQVLDKIGPTMAVLRQDIFQNIQRLELQLDTDPKTYSNVIEILKKEATEGSAKKRDSCSRALLWLTRSLDFTVTLLEIVAKDPNRNMEQVVEESYNLTLKPWHGWISSAAYKVALKLLPDNKAFIELLVSKGENFNTLCEEIQSLIPLLVTLLDDIHVVLEMYDLDRLKCT